MNALRFVDKLLLKVAKFLQYYTVSDTAKTTFQVLMHFGLGGKSVTVSYALHLNAEDGP